MRARIAYRQKLAFIFYEPDDFLRKVLPLLLTSFENINFVWFPEYETRGYEEPQSDYTKFEKVEIQSGVCTVDANGNWTITIKLKNSGTATSKIISIFINDVEIDTYNTTAVAGEWTTDMTSPYSIPSGQSATIKIHISSGKATATLSSGTTVNIKLHSAGGMDYIKLVELV